MENLNAEQVKRGLERCANEWHCGLCGFTEKECALIKKSALALINSQEQKIKELTEENGRLTLEYAGFEAGAKRVVRGLKTEIERLLEDVARLKFDLADAQADTARRLREMVNKRLDADTSVFTQQRYIVIDVINKVAKELAEGENSQERLRNERNTTK